MLVLSYNFFMNTTFEKRVDDVDVIISCFLHSMQRPTSQQPFKLTNDGRKKSLAKEAMEQELQMQQEMEKKRIELAKRSMHVQVVHTVTAFINAFIY